MLIQSWVDPVSHECMTKTHVRKQVDSKHFILHLFCIGYISSSAFSREHYNNSTYFLSFLEVMGNGFRILTWQHSKVCTSITVAHTICTEADVHPWVTFCGLRDAQLIHVGSIFTSPHLLSFKHHKMGAINFEGGIAVLDGGWVINTLQPLQWEINQSTNYLELWWPILVH